MKKKNLTNLVLLGVASGSLLASGCLSALGSNGNFGNNASPMNSGSMMRNGQQSYSTNSDDSSTSIPSTSGMNQSSFRSSRPFDNTMEQQFGKQKGTQPFSSTQDMSNDSNRMMQQQNMQNRNSQMRNDGQLALFGWGEDNKNNENEGMQANDRNMNSGSSWQMSKERNSTGEMSNGRDSDRMMNSNRTDRQNMNRQDDGMRQGQVAWQEGYGRPSPKQQGRILNRNAGTWTPRSQNGCSGGCGK